MGIFGELRSESVDNIRLRSGKTRSYQDQIRGDNFLGARYLVRRAAACSGVLHKLDADSLNRLNFAAVRYESLDGGVIYPRIVAEYRNSFLLAVIRFQNSRPVRSRI